MQRKFTDIENSGMAYVYEHWRPDTNQCFWVGKGTTFRYRVYRRNRHYNNIAAKLKKYGLKIEVRFVAAGLSDEDAYQVEIDRILFWKEHGVPLTNAATGGRGGMSGIKRSTEARAKQSATIKINGRSEAQVKSDLVRLEWARSEEGREFVRQLHTGRKRPPETGAKISSAMIAIGHKPPGNKGIKTSDATKAKQSAAKTPEARAVISAIVKEKWQEPGERERRSAAMSISNTGRIVTGAARESLSKAMTAERQYALQEAARKMRADPQKYESWRASLRTAAALRVTRKAQNK